MNKQSTLDPMGATKPLKKQASSDVLKNILSELPDGVKVALNFNTGIAEWNVTQKPVGFSVDEECSLIKRLSAASFKIDFE